MGGQQGRLQPYLLCFVDYRWKKINITAQKHQQSLFAGRNFTSLHRQELTHMGKKLAVSMALVVTASTKGKFLPQGNG